MSDMLLSTTPRIQQTSVHIQTANHVIQRILGGTFKEMGFFLHKQTMAKGCCKMKDRNDFGLPLQWFLRYVHDSCIWHWSNKSEVFPCFAYVFGNPPMNLGAPDQGLAPSHLFSQFLNFLVCFSLASEIWKYMYSMIWSLIPFLYRPFS